MDTHYENDSKECIEKVLHYTCDSFIIGNNTPSDC